MADIDQEFVEFVVKAIVDKPDKVEISRSVDERGVLLELTVDPEDMGKIIGKSGATAKSIRTLLRVLGAKNDARFNLKIVEPEGSERPVKEEVEEANEEAEQEAAAEPAAEEDTSENKAEDIKAKAREGLEDLDLDV
ncbi:KH domain-containing protein [Candidatus Saccharibacteria bacterium]|nr:KH domain-containing protein [Candidatus Saccharibacteria bacterium]